MQSLAATATAPAAAPLPQEPRAFAFSDVVGSSALVEQLGDERFALLMREHNRVVRAEIAGRGEEAAFLGDGFMVAFPGAADAIEWAVAVQRALGALREEGIPLRVRIGVHAGRAVREGITWLGRDVIVARRLCELAEPGEILITRELCDAWGATPLSPVRNLQLRGLSQAAQAFHVAW